MLNIKQRQMNLKFLGYYNKSVDGIEGAGTKQAYKDFQKNNGLAVDGIYGVKTDAKLTEIIKEIQRSLGVAQDGIAGQVTTNARDSKLSWNDIKHFKKSEFTCKCGCGMNNIDLKLVKILEEIRNHFGQAVVITSGCRCKKHNADVGGVQGSRHVLGKASDIYVKGVSTSTLLAYTKSLVAQNKLRYTYTNNKNMNGVVHIDIN
ncbi:MAG: D-Ala-D-Ala carboxypeptidase family metallohydrolase [Clostridia bacterium]